MKKYRSKIKNKKRGVGKKGEKKFCSKSEVSRERGECILGYIDRCVVLFGYP